MDLNAEMLEFFGSESALSNEHVEQLLLSSPIMDFGSPSSASSSSSSDSAPPTPPSVASPPQPESTIVMPPMMVNNRVKMDLFPDELVGDIKHVIYNLLVESWNNPGGKTLVKPITITENGKKVHGFHFVESMNPEGRLAELYAQYVRNARLETLDEASIFTQDLYRFYLRACLELLSKYFHKKDKYTYIFDDPTFFIPGTSLTEAQVRLRNIKTISRRGKRQRTTE